MHQLSRLPFVLLFVLPQLMDAENPIQQEGIFPNCIPEQCMTRGELIILIRKLENELKKLTDMGNGKYPCGPQSPPPPQPPSVEPTVPLVVTQPPSVEPPKPPPLKSTMPFTMQSTKTPEVIPTTFPVTVDPSVDIVTGDDKDKNCGEGTCGDNAYCFSNHGQTHCVCKPHFIGNPMKGCTFKTKTIILTSIHIINTDGERYEYRGTCPFMFVKPCGGKYPPGAPWNKLEVLGQSEEDHRYPATTKLREIEVHVNSTNIFIDKYENVYVDGIKRRLPYYFPSFLKPKIHILRKPASVVVTDYNFKVEYSGRGNGWLKVDVPDIDGLKLCGLAGNMDGDCEKEYRYLDGKITKRDHPRSKCDSGINSHKEAKDEEYRYLNPPTPCLPGAVLTKLAPKCEKKDMELGVKYCVRLEEVKQQRGPFQNCSLIGDKLIEATYKQCLSDLCGKKKSCLSMASLSRLCQTELPQTPLNWRALTGCGELVCPPHSKFSTCAPGCHKTCSQPNGPKICTQACAVGCVCDDGYVWDEGICMPFSKCGCNDQYGENHPDLSQWLSKDCRTRHDCTHGKIQSSSAQPCHQNAHCGATANHIRGCVCNAGFIGDGYACEPSNSCINKRLCGVNQGRGQCSQTANGYKCSCNDPWTGSNCDINRHPRRNCHDLKEYYNITKSGYYMTFDNEVGLVYCKF